MTEIVDGKMVITVDLANVEPSVSKSGKSNVFATTGGAQQVRDGDTVYRVNMTVYTAR